MIFLAKEFTEQDWYPHFRQIKKILRKGNIPFTIKKQPTQHGLLLSIWASGVYIDEVRAIIASYYGSDPKLKKQEKLVNELSSNFERNWYLYLLAVIIHYGRWHPFVFWPLFVAILAAIFYPFFQYR